MFPVFATLDTWIPFTYSRNIAPSYVVAKCVHVFRARVVVPNVSAYFPPAMMPPPGSELWSVVAIR